MIFWIFQITFFWIFNQIILRKCFLELHLFLKEFFNFELKLQKLFAFNNSWDIYSESRCIDVDIHEDTILFFFAFWKKVKKKCKKPTFLMFVAHSRSPYVEVYSIHAYVYFIEQLKLCDHESGIAQLCFVYRKKNIICSFTGLPNSVYHLQKLLSPSKLCFGKNDRKLSEHSNRVSNPWLWQLVDCVVWSEFTAVSVFSQVEESESDGLVRRFLESVSAAVFSLSPKELLVWRWIHHSANVQCVCI